MQIFEEVLFFKLRTTTTITTTKPRQKQTINSTYRVSVGMGGGWRKEKLQSARILAAAWPKPAVPLEDCQREYGRVIRSASPRRSRYTEPQSFPPSCKVQRPGFSTGSRSGYLSGFINAACTPSLASNGKTTCQTKQS